MTAAYIRENAESALSASEERRPSKVARALGVDVRFRDLGSL